jgi:hypothetical protein
MIRDVAFAATLAALAFLAEWGIWRAVTVMARWRITIPRLKLPAWHLPRGPSSAGGRAMAYLLLTAGTLATVAANYAHAHSNPGAKALSAVIPVLLFIAFHVAAVDGRWWIRVTTGAVAVLCFAISYDHISALARSYGESKQSAVLYPLAIDGAMIVATFVLSRPSRTADKPAVPSAEAVREPVRPKPAVLSEVPKPVLSAVPEDKPRTNGFVRPLPPKPVRPTAVPKDNEARLSAATRIAAELGDKLSRGSLVEALRKEGYTINTNEAAALTRQLKAARS